MGPTLPDLSSPWIVWAVGLLTLGLVSLLVWLLRLEHLERTGGDIHAHSDGTVHEHFRGSRRHSHPTTIERYDWLARALGPDDQQSAL